MPTLYERHVVDVYRYVHRRCLDRQLAEDITQDVFLAALAQGPDAVLTAGWLMRTARNRLIDQVRRADVGEAKRRLVGASDMAPDGDGDTIARLQVRVALESLPLAHRLVLALRYIDDLTVDELSSTLGRTPKGVEALLTRARRSFRAAMEDSS